VRAQQLFCFARRACWIKLSSMKLFTKGLMPEAIKVGPARADEAIAISAVLALNREDPGLFQEPASAVARSLGDFLVARDEKGEILGCASLHRDSPELAEIYAVAVKPQCQGKGIGQLLMRACQERARESEIDQLWLATIKPEYFARYGFEPITRWHLPASVLLRKLRQTFSQSCARWVPALGGRHTFMMKPSVRLKTSENEAGRNSST
jgi:amino-acid N-acetyltransferase